MILHTKIKTLFGVHFRSYSEIFSPFLNQNNMYYYYTKNKNTDKNLGIIIPNNFLFDDIIINISKKMPLSIKITELFFFNSLEKLVFAMSSLKLWTNKKDVYS